MIQINPSIKDPYQQAKESLPPLKIWRDAVSYAVIAIWQRIVQKRFKHGETWEVSPKTINKIKHDMWAGYLNHGYVDKADFARFWNQLEPILKSHRALVRFYLKNEVPKHSPTYPAWNLTTMVRDNYAQAMLVAIGEGLDYNGDPYKIEPGDPFYHGVVCGWTMNEARYRQMKARSALMRSSQALILGAGYLPELSPIYGGELPHSLKLDAVDSNPNINSFTLTRQYPSVDLTYHHTDMLDFLRHCPAGHYDTIILPGVMSYNLEDFDEIMELLKLALGEGGTIIFDLQVMHPELMYIYLMLDWSADQKMKLINLKEAVAMVEAVCNKLGLRMEHSQSGYYKTTCAELFEVTKI